MKESLESLIAQHPEFKDRIEAAFPEFFPKEKEYTIWEMAYNQYKGSGKCWVARVDPETKKVIEFLESESKQPRDNYSGKKLFKIPLVEGYMYLGCESGSKSTDSRFYSKVIGGKLIAQ